MPHFKIQPFIIALIGPVGSGKTRIARILAEKLGAIHINTDVIRVALRRKKQPQSRAVAVSRRRQEKLLCAGKSLVLDYDIVNPARRRELRARMRQFGVKIYFIKIKTPERLILARLRKKRYTSRDLFRNSEEAIRVYFFRRKFHAKPRSFTPDFTIDNSKPLGPQITPIVKHIKGL